MISSGRALDLDINVHGAPNFRAPHPTHFTSPSLSQSVSTPPLPSSSSSPISIPSTSSGSTPVPTLPSTATNLNVYGCAQPRTQGLRAILSVLRCRPGDATNSVIGAPSGEGGHVVWFCTREEPIGKILFCFELNV